LVGKLGNAGVTVRSLSVDDGSMIIVGASSGLFDETTVIRTSTSGSRHDSSDDVK
jgi:hypothetical protein